ncbi:MAG: adenine-specific methyltransferase EcoRI family protein [Clostridia bacterium]|nr:adenine-specific methyltransferase EcoRI family protein [Clostridia bacterium]
MPKKNDTLSEAKTKKSDEFYTQFEDIQREVNAYLEYNPDTFKGKTVLLPCDDPEWSNFTRFFAQNFDILGLKKLISTSYATESKKLHESVQISFDDFLTDFEKNSPNYDEDTSKVCGKIFILEKDINNSGRIDLNDLQWEYLEGDGDFRSEEVTKLRDEADIIVTNPPFSLFREFLAWIMQAKKKFLIIGNVNAISYKETFPLIKNNSVWLGESIHSGDREFGVPSTYPLEAAGYRVDEKGNKFIRVKGVRWFTNLDHGRRHQPISLMTMADNVKYSSHKEIKENGYQKYDNYDAIEIPYSDAIPSDYFGIMGVPITFIDKYCPEQFEILGMESSAGYNADIVGIPVLMTGDARPTINGKTTYARIFIRKKVI